MTLPEEYADQVPEEDEEEEAEEEKRRRVPVLVKVLLYVAAVIGVSVLFGFMAWDCADEVLALTKPDVEVTVTIPEDATMKDVTAILAEKGLVEMDWLFNLYCSFSNAERKIDPGTYVLNHYYDYHALVNGMAAGVEGQATEKVTIPEGYEAKEIFALLEAKGICSVSALEQAAVNYDFDYDFLELVPVGTQNRLEGYLFPDTYEFYVGSDPEVVLSKFLANFDRKFDETLENAIGPLNEALAANMKEAGFSQTEIDDAMMDSHKVIILASLIEKESSSTNESALISSVIYNRIASKDYPLLQIDATVQYALEERKEILTNADLAVNSPYNTYRHPGLPVGPIANPGILSIKAALQPEDTDFYFYALNTDGSHHFTETYYEHNAFLQELKDKND